MLADENEHRDEHQQHPDRLDAGASGQDGDEHGAEREHQAEQQARGQEQADGVLEIETEAVVAAAPLHHQPKRKPHQYGERGLDGTDVHGDDRQDEQEERNHLRLRLINPLVNPAFRRRRSSTRFIRPRSCGSS